jgi:hypothetical protein
MVVIRSDAGGRFSSHSIPHVAAVEAAMLRVRLIHGAVPPPERARLRSSRRRRSH